MTHAYTTQRDLGRRIGSITDQHDITASIARGCRRELQTEIARLSSSNGDRERRRAHRETRSVNGRLGNRQAFFPGIAKRERLRRARPNFNVAKCNGAWSRRERRRCCRGGLRCRSHKARAT